MRRDVSGRTGCAEEKIAVDDTKQGIGYGVTTAAGCDRSFICTPNGSLNVSSCTEDEASTARTAVAVVTDRLSMETGCAPANIHVTQEANWTRGIGKTYRLDACGKPYVCTTETARTECKAPLASETP